MSKLCLLQVNNVCPFSVYKTQAVVNKKSVDPYRDDFNRFMICYDSDIPWNESNEAVLDGWYSNGQFSRKTSYIGPTPMWWLSVVQAEPPARSVLTTDPFTTSSISVPAEPKERWWYSSSCAGHGNISPSSGTRTVLTDGPLAKSKC